MKLPSEQYFTSVQTLEDYVYFKSTGLLYELEPNAPFSWEEHKQMCEEREKNINMEEGE